MNLVAIAPAGDWTTESWSADGRIEDLRAEFAGWSDELTALLAGAIRTARWALLVQSLSRGRQETNHLPDGPAQQRRDAAMAGTDPLTHNGWIHEHDAELAAHQALAGT